MKGGGLYYGIIQVSFAVSVIVGLLSFQEQI